MADKYNLVLTIAGSDGSGGAGIQADLKTFAALGCYGLSVITAITAQNTKGVDALFPLPALQVKKQLLSLFNDFEIETVKIGVVCNEEIIEVISEILANNKVKNVILDPIILSSSGKELLSSEGLKSLINKLIPLTTLLTPNLPEAHELVKDNVNLEIPQLGTKLQRLGANSVLVKGGHSKSNESNDYLITPNNKIEVFKSVRINTENTHGTGCTLSSAIAAYLASGMQISEAVKLSKAYLTQAMVKGGKYKIGSGKGPLHHFHNYW